MQLLALSALVTAVASAAVSSQSEQPQSLITATPALESSSLMTLASTTVKTSPSFSLELLPSATNDKRDPQAQEGPEKRALEELTPRKDISCHNDVQCEGGVCYGGICIAPP